GSRSTRYGSSAGPADTATPPPEWAATLPKLAADCASLCVNRVERDAPGDDPDDHPCLAGSLRFGVHETVEPGMGRVFAGQPVEVRLGTVRDQLRGASD